MLVGFSPQTPWFCYDQAGIECFWFATEAEALEKAKKCVEASRPCPGDSWPADEVEQIVAGCLTYAAGQHNIELVDDEDDCYHGEFDYTCDYAMLRIAEWRPWDVVEKEVRKELKKVMQDD